MPRFNQLRAQGLQVVVNRSGTAPLDQCTINAVRPGQKASRAPIPGSGNPGSWDDLVTTMISKTVYVDSPADIRSDAQVAGPPW